jgi:hypothetical protein
MFRPIRFIFRVVTVFFIALLVLAYFTNPTMDDFKSEAKDKFNNLVQSQTENPTLTAIAALGTSFTDQIIDKMVTRKDYFICSIYTVDLPDGSYSFIGAFRMFFPLQKENPFDMVKQRIEELRNNNQGY